MLVLVANPGRWYSFCLLCGFLAAVLCGCERRISKEPAAPGSPASSVTGGVSDADEPADQWSTADSYALLAVFNRGCALMEQYRYMEAAERFAEVVAARPDWLAAQFNLGLAYLNMEGTEGTHTHLDVARDAFLGILETDPRNPHAHFCLGMLFEHKGEADKAAVHYAAVAEVDPEDPHVLYKHGLSLIEAGQVEDGAAQMAKAVEIDPGFISAIYRLALLHRRTGEIDKVKALMDRFTALQAAEMSGGSFAIQWQYGAAGKYYRALDADSLPREIADRPEPPSVVFSPDPRTLDTRLHAWSYEGGGVSRPVAAAGDVDGDGDLDLFLAATDPEGTGTLWLNDGTGTFQRGDDLATRVTSASFGDVDNDGSLDLWLGRAGAPLLLLNDGTGKFTPAPYSDQSPDGPGITSAGRLVDVDSDGDLDLLAFRLADGLLPADTSSRSIASLIFNNNRDGSFEEIADRLGLQFADFPIGTVVHDDFDNDRDLDMIAFPAWEGETRVWVNDRVWEYRVLGVESTGLDVQRVVGATSADLNKNGRQDLIVFADDQVHLFWNQGQFRFVRDEEFAAQFSALGGTTGQAVDIDNDGDLDLIIADARQGGTRGPVLLINDRGTGTFHNAAELDPRIVLNAVETPGDAGCLAADFTGNGRCDLLLLAIGEQPMLFENLTADGNWLALDLRGVRRQDNMGRSNNSAIGARVEVKTGTVIQQFTVGVPTGPGIAPPLRIHAGLGPFETVDWVRIYWPDAVLQAELELPANQVLPIEETPRKTSSCPALFAWDGSHYRFVNDFAGVGGLGFFLAPGQYAPPHPTEYVPIPVLEPQDGEYVLQVVVQLEEVAYLDEAKLVAVDHPLGTEVWPHAMMPVNYSLPPFELFCTRDTIEVVRAVDHQGTDVTDRLAAVDRHYAGVTQVDPRFLGFAEPHFVELDFGDQLQNLADDARLILFLHGWVEYGYSSTNFAAYQAGLSLQAPTIQIEREGRWIDVLTEVGYPAGLQHVMSLDMTGVILPGDRKLRIASNMELYWDRIHLGVEARSPLVVREAAVTSRHHRACSVGR
jgi:tetratricopeptide (TPR) repeat protein